MTTGNANFLQSGQKNASLINGGKAGRIPMDNEGSVVASLITHGGTFTANGATGVVVADANVTADSLILITLKSVNAGTPAGQPFISAITPGTGFTVKAVAGDTGIYNYAIIG